MSLKIFRADTPSKRGLIQVDRSGLWKGEPVKALTFGLKNKGGRNNYGRITTAHQGGGHKRLYRFVDFKRTKRDMEATVERLEYDPNRTAFIALIKYEDNTLSYIIAPHGIEAGAKVIAGENVDIKVGNSLPLKHIPVGTIIHNIEMKPGKGGQLARSAGGSAEVVSRDSGYTQIKLGSGEVRLILSECYATVGSVSNPDQKNIKKGKAGRNRWLGIRPCVRGVAKNPVDHPHGGGNGKTSGGRHPVTPWGKPTKGKKTRHNKRTNCFIIKRRGK